METRQLITTHQEVTRNAQKSIEKGREISKSPLCSEDAEKCKERRLSLGKTVVI